MIVKLNLNSFNGHAEISGAELDQLTKILSKFFGTDQRYVNSRYVTIRDNSKLVATFEVATDIEFMARDAYEAERQEQEAREAKLAAEQAAERVFALDWLIYNGTKENHAALLQILCDQNLLYYSERPENNPVTDWCINAEGVTFYAGKIGSMKRISLDRAGELTRTEAGF